MSNVFVGLSGGVDSSVSAALLQEQGHEVVGAFIEAWQPEGFPCSQEQDRIDAMRVAAELAIPFELVDAKEAYRAKVAQYMIDAYRRGETPNPDVMCNREVKFGVLYEYAMQNGAEYLATGHYAQKHHMQNSKLQHEYALLMGADREKDQSYFLWTLTQEKLAHTLFPIGHLTKSEVRTKAAALGLSTARKKDSQGLCFLGKLDMRDFLAHYIPPREGVVLNTNGDKIGTHDGAWFYTPGQRHGFRIKTHGTQTTPHYVIEKNIEHNTITVSTDPRYNTRTRKLSRVVITDTNWIRKIPNVGSTYEARLRYRQPLFDVTIESCNDTQATVLLHSLQPVPIGQSLVLYDGDACMGGGILTSSQ